MKKLFFLLLAATATAATLPLYIDTATNVVVSPDAPTTLDGYLVTSAADSNFLVGDGSGGWVEEAGDVAIESLLILDSLSESVTIPRGTFDIQSVNIGVNSFNNGPNSVVLGYQAGASQGAIAIGHTSSAVGTGSIQLGTGTNVTDNTIQFSSSGSVTAPQFGRIPQIMATEVRVTQASDLSGTLSSSVVYVIDGPLDMGAQSITVPTGGLALRSTGSIDSAMTSTEAGYTMFIDSADDAGSVVISGLAFTTSGVGSKVFDLTSDGTTDVFSIDRCAFIACTEIGTIDSFGIVTIEMSQNGFCSDGWTFDGDVIIFDFIGNASTGMISGGIQLQKGAAFSVLSNMIIEAGTFDVPAGVTFCDFNAGNFVNDASFELIFNNIAGAGTFLPNMDGSDLKARWRDNNFDPPGNATNTYVGSEWHIATGDTATTTIVTQGVYVKVAGQTTYIDEAWFASVADNAQLFASGRTVKAIVLGSINFIANSGGQDKFITLTVRHWDDSATAYIDLPGKPRGTATSAGAIRNASVFNFVTLELDDRVELWIQNDTDTTNLTVVAGSIMATTERAN